MNRQQETAYFIDTVIVGRKIEIDCLYKATARTFRDYLSDYETPDLTVSSTQEAIERIYHEELGHKAFPSAMPKSWMSIEYASVEPLAILREVARKLLEFDILLMHGAAVVADGCCYILAAPSGVGKTTHAANCLKMIPGTWVLNGDKPLINVASKTVYGSPWCGKEGMGLNASAPLSAIVDLRRGKENHIEPISFHEMLPTLLQQTYIPKQRDLALSAYQLVGKLSEIPCYRLYCTMDSESALAAHVGLTTRLSER